jgi:hypothetical protein
VCINRDYRYVELINTDTEEKRYVKLLFDTEPDMDEYVSRLNSKSDMLIMIQKKTGNVFAVSLDDIVNSEKVKVEGVLNGILHNGEEIINFFVVGKYSLLLMKDKKKLKVIDVDDYICEEYTLENSKREMSDIIVQGGKAYVLYRDGSIYVYDVITRKMIDCIYQAQDENDGKMYGRFCIVSGVIWVLPFSKDDIFSVDMEGKKKVIYENYPADFQYQFPENHPKFASITETKTHIYVGQRNANYMMVIDKSTGKEEWVQIKLPTEFHTKYLLDRFLENNDVIEESTVSLSAFVERVGQA